MTRRGAAMGRFAVLLLCAAPVLAAPVPKALKKQPPSLTSTWEMVELTRNGRPVKFDEREFWVFDASTYAAYDGLKDASEVGDLTHQVYAGSLVASDPEDPTAVDLLEGRARELGRFLVDGDTLHIATTRQAKNGRPAKAKPGPGITYLKLQRVDPTKLKPVEK